MPVPVPLITPRYQKKSRTRNNMSLVDPTFAANAAGSVSESSSVEQSTTNSQHSTPVLHSGAAVRPAHDSLRERSEEVLHIKHGEARYTETVQFHTFELFRHGKRQVQSRSVGYSSDGDLVMFKDKYAMVSDSDGELVQDAGVAVDHAVCLNPAARRPLSETEAQLAPSKIKAPRFRKYPGIKCPKNRKVRNRLMNDHFSNQFARKIFEACQQNVDLDTQLQDEDLSRPVFPSLSRDISSRVVHVEEDRERREFERLGVQLTPPLHPANPPVLDPNSGEARFQALNSKLRDELRNALGSEFLTQQIVDLETYFTRYITGKLLEHEGGNTSDDAPMVFQFRDGYGRLVCHGVAAYYNLISTSRTTEAGDRQTVVSLPKKSGTVALPTQTLMQVLCRRNGRSPVMSGAPSPILPAFNLDDPLLVYSEKHVDAAIQQTKSDLSATQKKKLRKTMKQLVEQLDDIDSKLQAAHDDRHRRSTRHHSRQKQEQNQQ